MIRARAVVWIAAALLSGACSESAPVADRDEDPSSADDDEPTGDDGQDIEAAVPRPNKDAGGVKLDAGKPSTSSPEAGSTPTTATGDASTGKAPDAAGSGATAQDGGKPTSSADGGAAAAPDAGAALCTLPRYADGPGAVSSEGFPVLEVNGGVTVRGVGCAQQWEGIVMTNGGRGLCTASFISERHLISASHCYANDGAVSLKVSAPTWDNGMQHTFQATVKRSGSNMALDVSVIDLGAPVPWATPERRYVLHAGTATMVDLHLYGFGSGGSSGGAGTLRGVPNRATLRVTDIGRGTLGGKAGPAQLCTGDSGGPAFVEKSAPVIYGINQAITPSGFGGGRTCAQTDWGIIFTNVSEYVPFVEKTLGKPCERKRVDDLDVAQCW